jgi:isopenicillin-N epimerase
LNHGAFGACPKPILELQSELRRRMEADPVRFLALELEAALDEVRRDVASFVGADADGLVFVPNATSGVNTVLASIDWRPGDVLLVTQHGYPACTNAATYWATRGGATIEVADLEFPFESSASSVERILAKVTSRTRLVLFDHVTSPSAIVLPVVEVCRALRARGVASLVDGAHAPGMLPLDLRALDADYYVGNLHKWCCSPKAAGFLYARREWREALRPLVISHGAASPRCDRARLKLEFDWLGTSDPTALLCVPSALRFVGGLLPGGWPEVFATNHALAAKARQLLADELGLEPPCPEESIGSMAALDCSRAVRGATRWTAEQLYTTLLDRYRIQVPVNAFPSSSALLIRISAHLYNSPEDYVKLAEALERELS